MVKKLRKTGKINYFNKDKGFGFILSEDGKSLFVHINNVSMNNGEYPEIGQKFSFIEVNSKKGIMAVDVVPETPVA